MIAISAGNHAQAVAFAAAEEHVDALARHVARRIRAQARRHAQLRRRPSTSTRPAPPRRFDRLCCSSSPRRAGFSSHPHAIRIVIAGAGTVGLEIEEEAPDADVVIVAVGGGGLVSGIVAAIGDRTRIVAVEPALSRALDAGIEAGHPVPVEPRSIADGLNAPFAGALPVEMCRDLERVLLTETEIEDGFRFLYERAHLACEPARRGRSGGARSTGRSRRRTRS